MYVNVCKLIQNFIRVFYGNIVIVYFYTGISMLKAYKGTIKGIEYIAHQIFSDKIYIVRAIIKP